MHWLIRQLLYAGVPWTSVSIQTKSPYIMVPKHWGPLDLGPYTVGALR